MLSKALWLILSWALVETITTFLLVRSFGLTIFLTIIFSSFVGFYLLLTLGKHTVTSTAKAALGNSAVDSELPKDQVKLAAASLLAIPGPISTMMGLLLLVPPIGRYARKRAMASPIGNGLVMLSNALSRFTPNKYSDVVEVDLVRNDAPETKRTRPTINKTAGEDNGTK